MHEPLQRAQDKAPFSGIDGGDGKTIAFLQASHVGELFVTAKFRDADQSSFLD